MRVAHLVLWIESEWDFIPGSAVDGSRVRRRIAATLWISCIDWDCVDRMGIREGKNRERNQLEGDVGTQLG